MHGGIIKMKTNWGRQYLNSFHLNSVLNLVGKRHLPLRNINGSPRLIFKVKTFVSDVRWRSSLQSPAIFSGICRHNSVSARNFHTSFSFAKSEEKKKPETLQELVEATEKQETALTVGQKGRYIFMSYWASRLYYLASYLVTLSMTVL